MKGIKNFVTKEKVNAVMKVAQKTINYAIPIFGLVMYGQTVTDKLDMIRYNTGAVKYDDAVRAIMRSSMWSEDKSKAVAMLRDDGSSNFYKAIIDVVRSSMWSNDKIKTIQDLCKSESLEK